MPLLPGVGELVTHFPTPVTVFLFLHVKLINLQGEILSILVIYTYVNNVTSVKAYFPSYSMY